MPVRFQVDPDFYDHPKALDLSDAAVALWVRAGSYSAAKTSDGFVAENALARLSKTPREAAEELRRSGLWHKVRGGYRFHEWEARNLTRSRIEADRKADRERKKGNRAAKNNTSEDARSSDDASTQPAGNNGTAQVNHQNVRPDSNRIPTGFQPDSNRIPPVSVSVSVSESVSGSGRAAVGGDGPPGGEPPSRCDEHKHETRPPNCGACAEARKTHGIWTSARAKWERESPRCRKHRGQPAHNCGICRSEKIGGN